MFRLIPAALLSSLLLMGCDPVSERPPDASVDSGTFLGELSFPEEAGTDPIPLNADTAVAGQVSCGWEDGVPDGDEPGENVGVWIDASVEGEWSFYTFFSTNSFPAEVTYVGRDEEFAEPTVGADFTLGDDAPVATWGTLGANGTATCTAITGESWTTGTITCDMSSDGGVPPERVRAVLTATWNCEE